MAQTRPFRIVLGSGSKYRQQLLREMGYEFEVVNPSIDEKSIRLAEPAALALALAHAKADAVIAGLHGPALVIAADQVVAHDGQIREKPASAEEARHFMRTGGESPSETVSAVVVTNTATGRRAAGLDVVRIYLRPLPDEVIEERIADGEVFYCAGALRIEDPVIAPYVERIDGAIDSVMGLPKLLTQRLIDDVTRTSTADGL
jgi:septum formation protein